MEDMGAAARAEELVALGRAIRGLRGEARLSQEALAAEAGISRSTMRRIELGEHDYMTSTLIALARALRVGPDELFRRAGLIR